MSIYNSISMLKTLNQTQPHPKMSQRYKFVSTKDVIEVLNTAGFETASYLMPKRRDTLGFSAHTIRFNHPSFPVLPDGTRLQGVLTNSFDGTAAFSFSIGLFRMVCSNGLYIGEPWAKIRLKHVGTIQQQVSYLLQQVPERVNKVLNATNTLMQYAPSKAQCIELARKSLERRLDKDNITKLVSKSGKSIGQVIDDLIEWKRDTDDDSLWTVMNNIQERLSKKNSELGLRNLTAPTRLQHFNESIMHDALAMANAA